MYQCYQRVGETQFHAWINTSYKAPFLPLSVLAIHHPPSPPPCWWSSQLHCYSWGWDTEWDASRWPFQILSHWDQMCFCQRQREATIHSPLPPQHTMLHVMLIQILSWESNEMLQLDVYTAILFAPTEKCSHQGKTPQQRFAHQSCILIKKFNHKSIQVFHDLPSHINTIN